MSFEEAQAKIQQLEKVELDFGGIKMTPFIVPANEQDYNSYLASISDVNTIYYDHAKSYSKDGDYITKWLAWNGGEVFFLDF